MGQTGYGGDWHSFGLHRARGRMAFEDCPAGYRPCLHDFDAFFRREPRLPGDFNFGYNGLGDDDGVVSLHRVLSYLQETGWKTEMLWRDRLLQSLEKVMPRDLALIVIDYMG